MFISMEFLLVTIAVVVTVICYVLILAKSKAANESSEFSKLLQETYEELPVQRRTELLEKIKEERIKEYLDKKKRKNLGDS